MNTNIKLLYCLIGNQRWHCRFWASGNTQRYVSALFSFFHRCYRESRIKHRKEYLLRAFNTRDMWTNHWKNICSGFRAYLINLYA